MSFAAGDRITAARLNNLQTRVFYAFASGSVPASQTNADIPDATVTFTTLTDNAVFTAFTVFDFNATGTPAGTSTARLNVDGLNMNPLATFNATGATERGTVAQNYSSTLGTAGSHTLKLIGTTSTNTQIQANSSILVLVEEVV